jgi:hypothetical protein
MNPRVKLLKRLKGVNVWLVDGGKVRDNLSIDFSLGGHDLVYKYIPKGEIWVENHLSSVEQKKILLHEIHERNLMALDNSYKKAHGESNIFEAVSRSAPEGINYLLKQEFDINKRIQKLKDVV